MQAILGHKRINTTLVYARAHDQTVAGDYYLAMKSVERRMEQAGQPEEQSKIVQEYEREQLLALTEQLAQPEISQEARLDFVMRL